MRELMKSMLSLPWAMLLFGVRQAANLVAPREATLAFDAVTQAAEAQLGSTFKGVYQAGDQLQRGMVDLMFRFLSPDPPAPASDQQQEEAVVRYTAGQARFTQDGTIVVQSKLYKPDGEENGSCEVVFDIGYVLAPENANRWYQWFDLPPRPSYDPLKPDHKADPNEIRAQARATWTFRDGSRVTATGPAFFNLARFKDGSSIFFHSFVGTVTSGSGRYHNATGKSISQGSAHLEKETSFGPGSEFPVQTVASLQLIQQADIVDPSPAWPYQFKTIKVQGRTGESFDMSYIEEGMGDPIVFLHGNPNWSYTWRNVIPYLMPLGRCIAIDFIGMDPHQLTPQVLEFTFEDHLQFFNDFVAEKDLKNMTLVIHDWGSAIGFDYAMRHEDNVKAVVFMEMIYKNYPNWQTFPEPDAPELVRQNFKAFREGYPSKASFGYRQIVENNVFIDVLTPTITGRTVTEAEMVQLRQPFTEPRSREAIWRWVNEIPIEGQPKYTSQVVERYHVWLQQTNLPKLFIYTVPGMIITQDSAQWIETHLKNLTAVNIGPGLHYPHETNPDLVGRTIAQWYHRLSIS
jgi:haloalkane dehalogenase